MHDSICRPHYLVADNIDWIYLYIYFFDAAKQMELQMCIVWMQKISIANYSNHNETQKNSRHFFTSFRNYWSEMSLSIWKIDIVCKTYHASALFCVVWSRFVFFRGMCVLRFALHWMANDSDIFSNRRFRIDVIPRITPLQPRFKYLE